VLTFDRQLTQVMPMVEEVDDRRDGYQCVLLVLLSQSCCACSTFDHILQAPRFQFAFSLITGIDFVESLPHCGHDDDIVEVEPITFISCDYGFEDGQIFLMRAGRAIVGDTMKEKPSMYCNIPFFFKKIKNK